MKSSLTSKLISLLTCACLAISCVVAGFAACALPNTSCRALSWIMCDADNSPFTRDELVTAALATKDYAFGSHDESALLQAICEINLSAQEDGRSASGGTDGAPDLSIWEGVGTELSDELREALETADESYVLTPDAISHLDDVYWVVATAYPLLAVIALAALEGLIYLCLKREKKMLGTVLVCAGTIVLVLFALCALWVIIDFDGFFTAFHSLFFAAGTWTFSSDSLLICMFPPRFWMAMGALWLGVTAICCLALILIGRVLRSGKHSPTKSA